MTKENARHCKRCAHEWYAVRVGTAQKPRWFDEFGAIWTDGQARMARRQGNYTRQKIDRDRWAQCPNCGSIKVKTVAKWGFVPSAARTGPQSPAQPSAILAGDRVLDHGQLGGLSSDANTRSSGWARAGALTRRALIAWWKSPLAVVVVMVLLATTGVAQAFAASTSSEPKSVGDRLGSLAMSAAFLGVAWWRSKPLRGRNRTPVE